MNPQSPLPSGYPSKRARHSSPKRSTSTNTSKGLSPTNLEIVGSGPDIETLPTATVATGTTGSGGKVGGQSSSFRNVSACNRCRLRKNRCDQHLPGCASCEKAGVKCVGYDPITKREIPRSYVFYLESRIEYLERVLQDNNISFAPAEVLDHGSRPGIEPTLIQTPISEDPPPYNGSTEFTNKHSPKEAEWNKKEDESQRLDKLVSNIGSVSVQGASDSRYLGSTSGISFARVVFAAVKSSVSGTNSDKSGVRPCRPPVTSKAVGTSTTSMRDSFFGLHTKPTIKQAPFPSKDIGRKLVELYFEHANPQIPILHRGEFMKMFDLSFADGDARIRTPRELYMLNIVFAIGSGVFLGDGDGEKEEVGEEKRNSGFDRQCQPEEYHASAIVHLESCLSSPSSAERTDGFGGGLEELQVVLLLAGFALLRPVAPGLWYITGVAVRLAVDLGLHYEDGKDIDIGLQEVAEEKPEDSEVARMQRERSARERGRREWVRDFRRRLWWCTYSFDRLVSTCVGRPFGITDQVVTTEFPSLLNDEYITPSGFLEPPTGIIEPSYKHVAYHYFRLRLLQSEILQVLQYQHAQQVRAGVANQRNPYMLTALPSPFLSKFESFRSWRIDIDKRLWHWKSSAPTKRETGVAFSVEFLELNYWQCVIMLYRQSLSVPPIFEGEFSTNEEVNGPNVHNVELREDEERVFLKVAEAGQRVLRLYRQLHRVHLVNYTFLSTHHLFMAGISFLYAIWHSAIVRSRLTMDEVDFTILAATSVLGDLIEKCPPAEACRDAFDRMSKATVQMCMCTTGFGSSAQGLTTQQKSRSHNYSHNHETSPDYFNTSNISFATSIWRQSSRSHIQRPKPLFDMGLHDLLGSPTQSDSGGKNGMIDIKNEFFPPCRQKTSTSTSISTIQHQPQNHNHTTSPSEFTISPPASVDTSSIDPSILPSPRKTRNSLTPGMNPASVQGQAYSRAVQSTYPTSPYQEIQFSFTNAPVMDFMTTGWDGSGQAVDTGGENGEGGNGNDLAWTGDLGMGMGWEGVGDGHDFSEASGGLDLFEGFFFGGTGNV
ncbi:related to positive transcriptional regulator for purine utilization [Rhynchosporium graminicola]|uniref:Related to positive transcriptional regulator for purine utilization n=1 Tax=Rhynchosporium graminicola TaxID=2792576 RepID=A0A1E1KVI8_9HELO|nr:related to positive transcriptional regulator for purine utilization [Rhynchosporium commune]